MAWTGTSAGGAVRVGQTTAKSTHPAAPQDSWWPSDWGGSALGSVVQGVGDFVRHAGELGDAIALAKQREIAMTGGSTDPLGRFSPVPPSMRGAFEQADPHVVSRVVAPTAASLEHQAQRMLPKSPNRGDHLLQGVGHAAVGLPTLISPPVAAGYYFADGYGRIYENALAHGATEDDARGPALLGGAVNGAMAVAPIPGARFFGETAARVASPILRPLARVAATSGVTSAFAAANQFTDNAIAKGTYNPDQDLSEGVGDNAVAGAILGAGGQLAAEGAPLKWLTPTRPAPLPPRTPGLPQSPPQPILQLGGAHRTVKRTPGYHSHHMPAKSVSPIPEGDGPAIAMRPADHRATLSYGNSREARAHRAKQDTLIKQGDFAAALQKDIDDNTKKFGDTYNEATAQMLKYARDRGYIE